MKLFSPLSKKQSIGLGILVLAVYTFVFLAIPAMGGYKKPQKRFYGGISYDSRAKDPNRAAIKHLPEIGGSKFDNLTVSFWMRAYSIGNYPNVFQTAPLNSGIRMELSKPSTLALLIPVGNFYRSTPQALLLTQAFKLGKWYRIRIVATGRRDFKVFLNNLAIIDNLSDSNDVSGPVSFDISDISVGAGFNKERIFDGEIRDFKIEYEMSERRKGLTRLFFVVRFFFWSFRHCFLPCFPSFSSAIIPLPSSSTFAAKMSRFFIQSPSASPSLK